VADLTTGDDRQAAGRAPGRNFVAGYADQTVADHAALQRAVADGRIEAVIDR
jgi:hypothetical protein